MTDTVVVGADALRQLSARLAEAMGAPSDIAAEVARHLVSANLSGHDSHGVLRWSQYVAELDAGQLDPSARARPALEGPVTAVLDAHRGFGQHSTMVATEWALAHAREHGLAAAVVRHSMHIGRLGEYTERLALEGLVGIVTVGVAGPDAGSVAPFGGAGRFLGTNPWSMGVPAGARPPLIYDAATSTFAEGKVRLARTKGVELPPGVVRDAAGRPTVDPAALYDGGMLSVMGGDIAGHKGHGLSLAAALVGGLAMIADPDPSPAGCTRPQPTWESRLAGVLVLALDPAAFGDPADYRRRVASVLDALEQVPAAPGVERVLVSGDPERSSRVRRAREGIPLPATTWEELSAIAGRFGLSVPAPLP